jgi:hypothetical protein
MTSADEGTRTAVASAADASPARASGFTVLGATALGAVAIGALAIGRLAIGRAVVRHLEAGQVHIRSLTVDELRLAGRPWQPSPTE